MIELRHIAIEGSGRAQAAEGRKHDARLAAIQAAHGERLRRFCLRLCAGNSADADDLLQETWVAAHESLPRFRGQAQITTWLFRIALYRWRQTRQQAGQSSWDEEDAATLSRIPDAAPATLDRLALADALLTLPEVQREAFLLVKAEQFTHREAAAILQVPQGTVQARVHDAVRRLRVLLTDLEKE